jgi:hypothetical protein
MIRSAMIVALVLAACGSTRKYGEDLVFHSRAYQEGLRWRRFDDAAARVPPPAREAFLDERDQLDHDLRIDDYEITRVKLGKDHYEGEVQVVYSWHLDSVGVVHETTVTQHWERHGPGWYVLSERRRSGDEMPGVAEPAPDSDNSPGSLGS